MGHDAWKPAGASKYLQGVVTTTDYPLVYLNVPKAACTTVKNLLYFMQFGRYSEAPLDIHASTELLRSRGGGPEVHAAIGRHMSQRHLVFTFVREPGRRAYSCFVEKVLHQKHRSFPHVRSLLERRYAFDLPGDADGIAGLPADRVADGFVKFLRFVRDNAADKTEIQKDAHWMPQSYIIKRYLQQFLPDFIGRVETFGRDFSYVLQHYTGPHVPDAGAKFNEGPTPPHRFEAVVDQVTCALLTEIYGGDYEHFGYAANDNERP
jgi:hypothetical protein